MSYILIKNLSATKTKTQNFNANLIETFLFENSNLLLIENLIKQRKTFREIYQALKTLTFSNFQYFTIKKLYQYYFELNNFNDVEIRLYYTIININYKVICNIINNALKCVNILIFLLDYLIGKIDYLNKSLIFLFIFYSVKLI